MACVRALLYGLLFPLWAHTEISISPGKVETEGVFEGVLIHKSMEMGGFEPPAPALRRQCSPTELHPLKLFILMRDSFLTVSQKVVISQAKIFIVHRIQSQYHTGPLSHKGDFPQISSRCGRASFPDGKTGILLSLEAQIHMQRFPFL